MPPTEDVTLESSPSTEAAPEYLSPEQMNPEQRTNWLLKGEIPLAGVTTENPPASGEEADAAAADGFKPEASSEKTPPASQPGKKPESQAKPRKQKDHNDRIRELLAENAALKAAKPAEDGVTRTSPPAQPAAATPPAQPQAQPAAVSEDVEPKIERKADGTRWKDWNEFNDAHKQWNKRETSRLIQAAFVERENQKAEQQIVDNWKERCNEAAKEFPDFKEVAFKPGGINVNQTTKAFLYTSPHGPKILYQLQKNPTVAAQLAQADPLLTARVLVTLENSLGGVATSAPASQATPAQPAAARTPKTKPTTTPEPPMDLGARNSAPADEEEAAVRNDDVRKFMEIDLRKRLGTSR